MTARPPLQELLEHLRRDGVALGVDDHLVVQRLLATDAAADPERLRLSLRALLARSAEEQAVFDRVWGLWFRPAPPTPPPPPAPLPGPGLGWAAFALGVLLVAVWMGWPPPPEVDAAAEATPELPDVSGLLQPAPSEPMAPVVDDLAPPAPSAAPPEPPSPSRPAALDLLRWIGLALLGLAVAVALRGALSERRRHAPVGPPLTFRRTLVADVAAPIDAQRLEDLAASLTGRHGPEASERLDVDASVRATVEAGGFAHLVFEHLGVSPRYAVLLDDDRAARPVTQELGRLLRLLAEAGVPVDRFRFHGRPDALTDERSQEVALPALATRGYDSLVIAGDTGSAVDPSDGLPAAWLDHLQRFPERLWLHARPEGRWDPTVTTVEASGTAVHATGLDVLRLAHPNEDTTHAPARAPWPSALDRDPTSPVALAALERWLGPEAWLALASAADLPTLDGPSVDWLLTTCFPSLSAEDRLAVLGVPWVAEGAWPRGVRQALLDEATPRAPAVVAEVRRAVDAALEVLRPPAGSGAELAWRAVRAERLALARDPRGDAEAAALATGPEVGRIELAESEVLAPRWGYAVRGEPRAWRVPVLVAAAAGVLVTVGAHRLVPPPMVPLPMVEHRVLFVVAGAARLDVGWAEPRLEGVRAGLDGVLARLEPWTNVEAGVVEVTCDDAGLVAGFGRFGSPREQVGLAEVGRSGVDRSCDRLAAAVVAARTEVVRLRAAQPGLTVHVVLVAPEVPRWEAAPSDVAAVGAALMNETAWATVEGQPPTPPAVRLLCAVAAPEGGTGCTEVVTLPADAAGVEAAVAGVLGRSLRGEVPADRGSQDAVTDAAEVDAQPGGPATTDLLAVPPEEVGVAAPRRGAGTPCGPWSAQHGCTVARIPKGTFTMGSATTESGRDADEAQVSVTLTRDSLLMTTEVTQGLYQAVLGKNPSRFKSCGAKCPVERVSWYDAVAFANALSSKDGLTPAYSISGTTVTPNWGANGWRLPTEAEWERAVRGGQSTLYAGGNEVDAVARYGSNSGGTTHAACTKTRNAYGLCDMSGNVWEWTWDWYAESRAGGTDPAGPSSGSNRVVRGGSWYRDPAFVRVANRFRDAPDNADSGLGFRLARSAPSSTLSPDDPAPPFPEPAPPGSPRLVTPPGTLRALLVGIDAYTSLHRLNSSVRDVALAREALGTLGADVDLVLEGAATRAGILDGLERLAASVGPGDTAWVHFSGHSARVADDDGDEPDGFDEGWASVEAKGPDDPGGAVRDDALWTVLNQLRERVGATGRVVWVVDAGGPSEGVREGNDDLPATATSASARVLHLAESVEVPTPEGPVGALSLTVYRAVREAGGGVPDWERVLEDAEARKPVTAVAGGASGSRCGVWSGRYGCTVARVPKGTFLMGSPESEAGRYSDEAQVEVTLTRDFLLMTTEVTQGMYQAVIGRNPSYFSSCGTKCPVENVSWLDAVSFANALSAKDGLTPSYSIFGDKVTPNWDANGWRLPTQAEWERAARGGRSTVYAGGDEVDAVAWTGSNSGSTTHAVCTKKPNAYGLCDMSGNVEEWTWDWNGSSLSGGTDPAGPSSGFNRVYRGGSWNFAPTIARVAFRHWNTPVYAYSGLGFRLARSAP